MTVFEEFFRKYWYAIIPVAGLLIVIAWRILSPSAARDETQSPGALEQRFGLTAVPEEFFQPAAAPTRRTPQEEAEEQVRRYREQLAAEPLNENTPVILMAMGNLYRQRLLNYDEAARCYERIIEEFPNAIQISDAYVQLSTCYQRMDAPEKANRLHLKMIERFPEDSVEHQFAREQLGWEITVPAP